MHTSTSRTFKNVTLLCPQESLSFDYVAILKRAGAGQPAKNECWVLLSQKRLSLWEPAALILTALSHTWDPAHLLTAQPTPHLLTRPINPPGQIETLLYLASCAASALMKVFIMYFAK